MGNRAVITTPERKIGLYLHWNGGRDTVEPLLRYCELKGYRPPSADTYGWARMAQVMGNFFGGTLSVGIGTYTDDERMDPGDNGIYVIDGWRIVERLRAKHDDGWRPAGTEPIPAEDEQGVYDFDEMLHALDRAMPEGERGPSSIPRRCRHRNSSWATRSGCARSTTASSPTRWLRSRTTAPRSLAATTATAIGLGTPTTAWYRIPCASPRAGSAKRRLGQIAPVGASLA